MAIARGLSDDEFKRRFFKENPNFLSGDTPNVDALSRDTRRNPTFRNLFNSGQLLPTADAPVAHPPTISGGLSDFQRRLDAISSSPQFATPRLDASLDRLSGLQQQLEGGTGIGETIGLAPEQRERLISGAEQSFGRVFNQRLEDILTQANLRGIVPQSGGQFSGLQEQLRAEARAETFENPLTSFIRDIDVQEEANRVRQIEQNRARSAEIAGFLTQGEQARASGNRSFIDALLGRIGGFEKSAFKQFDRNRSFDFQKDAFEREQRLLAQALLKEEDAVKAAKKERKQAAIRSGVGTLVGTGIGAFLGGPQGAVIGADIGSRAAGGQSAQGGSTDFSSLFSNFSPAQRGTFVSSPQNANFLTPQNFFSSGPFPSDNAFSSSPFERAKTLKLPGGF